MSETPETSGPRQGPPPIGAVRRAASAAAALARLVVNKRRLTLFGRRMTEAEADEIATVAATELAHLRGVYTKLAQVVGAYLSVTGDEPSAGSSPVQAGKRRRTMREEATSEAGDPKPSPDFALRGALGRALVRLQEGVPPMELPLLRTELERAWGGLRLDDVVEVDGLRVLAAASIGQVFHARLRKTGQEVAIKVQYPGIAEATRDDLNAFKYVVSAVIKAVGLEASPEAVVMEVRRMIGPELDYDREARMQNAFARFWSAQQQQCAELRPAYRLSPEHDAVEAAAIRVPRALVAEGLCGSGVITQELAEGVPFDAFVASADEVQRLRVALALNRFFHDSLYFLGLFHADPHPGNLRVANDGSAVWFLDYGCVRAISAESREISRRTLANTVVNDRQAMIDVFTAHPELRDYPERARKAVHALWPAFTVHAAPFDPRLHDPPAGTSVFNNAWLGDCHRVLHKGMNDVAGPADMLFMHRLTHGLNCMLVALAPPGGRAFWRAVMERYDPPPGTPQHPGVDRLLDLGDAIRAELGPRLLDPPLVA